MKSILKRIHRFLSQFIFDPLQVINNWRSIPYFIHNIYRYSKINRDSSFKIHFSKIYFTTADRFKSSGAIQSHYFHQDLWASRLIYEKGTKSHVDIGSRLDGFVANILTFCKVKYVDIRRMESAVIGLDFVQGSITNLPFEDNSIDSLSCLHVLEHIGLGRYGDQIDPQGHEKGAKELSRVLKQYGLLYFGTPIGIESLHFDAHRVFDPQTVLNLFGDLDLVSYALIDDKAGLVQEDSDFTKSRLCKYGCGLFLFRKSYGLDKITL